MNRRNSKITPSRNQMTSHTAMGIMDTHYPYENDHASYIKSICQMKYQQGRKSPNANIHAISKENAKLRGLIKTQSQNLFKKQKPMSTIRLQPLISNSNATGINLKLKDMYDPLTVDVSNPQSRLSTNAITPVDKVLLSKNLGR